jgi:radical SAM superfamily enzyme YgiQ (UPF0313 family)
MRILLIQPRVNAEPAYPLALAGMIPLLEGAGHTVEGIDLSFDDEQEIHHRIQDGQFDWVGATVLHHNTDEVARWMRPLQSVRQIKTFVAGALPTLDPTAARMHTGADFAIVGPPEETVADLVDARDPRTVEGVVHAGRAIPNARIHSPLSLLPLPDRRVFPVEQYSYAMRSMATPYTQVFTSRGCLHRCPYCPVPALRPAGFDARLADQVVTEWAQLVQDHGIASIHVEDDNFMEDVQRVRDICSLLKERSISVQWELVNGIRVDQVDAQLLHIMAAAGCTRIVFSFEHIRADGSPAVGYSWLAAQQAAQWARDAGMRVGGYFIVGLPGVSAQATLSSIRLGLQLSLDDANWVPFYETPGSGYSGAATTVDATSISRSHAVQIAKLAHIAFFAQPRSFARLASEMMATPATLPSLARKAVELIRAGGPVPMRDTP